MNNEKKTVLVTGSAGFIGFHLSELLLQKGFDVIGVDNLNSYYDIKLKQHRNQLLKQQARFTFRKCDISDIDDLRAIFTDSSPDYVIHLAAQAGVRYSIDHPSEYVSSNLVGTFNLLELIRAFKPKHFLFASTSSVYGANKTLPFSEVQKCDHQMSFYAATKKSNEVMSHAYSHIFGIPMTGFRFFTVYGPWGRPDMALFKFAKAITLNQAIDVYNSGHMSRDFTYVTDLCNAIYKLMLSAPQVGKSFGECDTLSPVAPWRVVNIGNSEPVPLMEFISELEKCMGQEAKKNFMEMQLGDVAATHANTTLLKNITGFQPETSVSHGVRAFVDWYLNYYQKEIIQ